ILDEVELPWGVRINRGAGWASLAAEERRTLELLRDALRDETRRIPWLSGVTVRAIRDRHLALFPNTPSIDELVAARILAPHSPGEMEGFRFDMAGGLWHELNEPIAALMWAALCRTDTFSSDRIRLRELARRFPNGHTAAPTRAPAAEAARYLDAALDL